MFGGFIGDSDGRHAFVIKMLALMALHLGETTLHLPTTEISQSLQRRKHTTNLDRDFLLVLFTNHHLERGLTYSR